MVAPEGFQKSGVAIIVAAGQDEASALDIPLHDLKQLAHLMVRLLLAVADVGEGEERLGATETAAKLGQGGIVSDREDARGVEGPRQTLDTEDYMDEYGVDVCEDRARVEVLFKLLMQLVCCLAATLLASGDERLTEDGPVAVDYNKSKRRRFLGTSGSVHGRAKAGGLHPTVKAR